jgi:hypothetical protein
MVTCPSDFLKNSYNVIMNFVPHFMFTLYNKNYQNVNSKRLQLTAVYFSKVNGYLALFLNFDIMASDTYNPRRGYGHNGSTTTAARDRI